MNGTRDSVIPMLRPIGGGSTAAVPTTTAMAITIAASMRIIPRTWRRPVPTRRSRANSRDRAAAAYFVVAEALTNVAKHSGAERCEVRLTCVARPETLVIEVTDDGHGGADESGGTGLLGIRRRVAAFDGATTVDSPEGGPTVLRVELPCGS